MHIFLYIILLIASFALEIGVVVFTIDKFYTDLINSDYKINFNYFTKLLKEEHKTILDYIIAFIPGINAIFNYFKIKHALKKLKTKPEFIINLEPINPVDKMLLNVKSRDNKIMQMMNRLVTYSAISDDIEPKEEKIDFNISKKELKKYGIETTKNVISKVSSLNEEHNDTNIVDQNKSFYTLPGEYSLSNVYKIDENPIFINTNKGTHIAVVNATEEDINNLASNLRLEKPLLDIMYHIVSLKNFDKDLIREALFEMEYSKSTSTDVIDAKFKEVRDIKKRTL